MTAIAPQPFTAKLADRQILNEKFLWLSFELANPHRLPFVAGQYVSLQVDQSGLRRSYSICSSPEKEHGFDLLIDVTPMGVGVQYLYALKLGYEVSGLGPVGRLTVDATISGQSPLVLVATGSGIAPLRSIVLDELQLKHNTQPIVLYWGLRYPEDLVWEDEFAELMQKFSNFHFHPVLSQAPEEWPLCRGHVTDCLQIHELPPQAHYYICGGQTAVTDIMQALANKEIGQDKIHVERFN